MSEDWEVALDDYSAEQMRARAEWLERWPNCCTLCFGWGGSNYQESHGFKGGGSETIFDPCGADPITQCHRCGEEHGLSEEGEGPCKFCGWNYDDGCPE